MDTRVNAVDEIVCDNRSGSAETQRGAALHSAWWEGWQIIGSLLLLFYCFRTVPPVSAFERACCEGKGSTGPAPDWLRR